MAAAYGDQRNVAGAVATAEGSPAAQQLTPVAATSAADEALVADADGEAGDIATNAAPAPAVSDPDAPIVKKRDIQCLTVKSGTVS